MRIRNLIFILFITFNISFAHTTKTFKRKYGNVLVNVTVNEVSEKINSGLIIAQYFDLFLTMKKKPKYIIDLYFFEDFNQQKTINSISKSKKNDTLTLVFVNNFFSVEECIKVLEFCIDNPSKVNDSNKKYLEIIKGQNSKYLDEILSHKILRPNSINELKLQGDYNYFYKKDSYVFYNIRNNEKLFDLKNKFSNFFDLENDNIVILTDTNLLLFNFTNKEQQNLEINQKHLRFSYNLIKLNSRLFYFQNRSIIFENSDMLLNLDKKTILYDLIK